MHQKEFNEIVEKILSSKEKSKRFLGTPIFGNIENLTKNAGGIYRKESDIPKKNHPRDHKSAKKKLFYVIEGYDLMSDQSIIWIRSLKS